MRGIGAVKNDAIAREGIEMRGSAGPMVDAHGILALLVGGISRMLGRFGVAAERPGNAWDNVPATVPAKNDRRLRADVFMGCDLWSSLLPSIIHPIELFSEH